MKTKAVYPVFIKENDGSYLVYIPDFNGYTEGKDFYDAVHMARDYISLAGVTSQDDGKEVPMAFSSSVALAKAKDEADEDFDFSDGIMTFVDVNFDAYRRSLNRRAVKKNCTIPYWMSIEADKRHINYSKVLQEALESIIGTPQNI